MMTLQRITALISTALEIIIVNVALRPLIAVAILDVISNALELVVVGKFCKGYTEPKKIP